MVNSMKGPGLVLLILMLCISGESLAQKQVNVSNQQWFQYYNTLQIGNQWAIQSDLGIRFRDELGDLSQTLIRSGIEYQWNNHILWHQEILQLKENEKSTIHDQSFFKRKYVLLQILTCYK